MTLQITLTELDATSLSRVAQIFCERLKSGIG
jgi:hypothetical protein